mmetsp:Transcript_105044/g.321939  ORF Transcript_105044/g.321939 Transcript_105044/m.321939 type:complete len:428 (-) Transcript_105044:346-1629(-)
MLGAFIGGTRVRSLSSFALALVVLASQRATAGLSNAGPVLPHSDAGGLRKVSLASVDPFATCNDGTPAVYYWAPGAGNATSWLFLLGDRGWCWDATSCAARPSELVSSADYPEVMLWDPDSIFGSKSAFVGYNRIWVPQCSSDAWMGDIGSDESKAGINWRGARIFKAALRDVGATRGLKSGDLLVFGGISAGARGAMVHIDTIQPLRLIPEGVKLVGYFDSPYYVEMPAFQNMTGIDFRVTLQTQQVVAAMQNDAILRGGGACELDEVWKCAFGEYRMPLLKTPFLLVASQYDWYGLHTAQGAAVGLDSKCFPDPQCAYYEYADEFRIVTKTGLLSLPQVLAGTAGLYSSTCYEHAQSGTRLWGLQRARGVTRGEALLQTIEASQDNGTMPLVVSTWEQLNGGSGCLVDLPRDCGCRGKQLRGSAR